MKTETNSDANEVGDQRLVRHLRARAVIAGDLYREGKITRAECFRLEVDAAHGEDTGEIQYEANDDHEFMMTGVGADHDEYRRRESLANARAMPRPTESGDQPEN